jgi:hypothetical protein
MRHAFCAVIFLFCSALTIDQTREFIERLQAAILQELTVWKKPSGESVYIAHCRTSSYGCKERAHDFASSIIFAAERHDVDAWLLASMALHESGMNPRAVGAAGETSIFQLHPKSRWGRRYKKICKGNVSRCTKAASDIAASLLSRSIKRCGNLRTALGMYNSGKCQDNKYSKNVVRRHKRLLRSFLPWSIPGAVRALGTKPPPVPEAL